MTKESDKFQFDVVIVGGGLAGASLACAFLSRHEQVLNVAVLEAYPIKTDAQPSYDDRTVALSEGSRRIFEAINLWPSFSEDAEPIHTIHISDRGHFGVTRLTSEQEKVDALGYVMENRTIGQHLYSVLQEKHNVTVFCPAQLKTLQQREDGVLLEVESDSKVVSISAALLVAADGANSQVLQLLHAASHRQDYKQSALITNITPGKKHNDVAYERFTETGPLAFLPMTENRCSVVWTLPPSEAEFLYSLDEEAFRKKLQTAFGFRLGEIKKTGKRQLYPLFLQSASQMVFDRVAVIGNAAHSVHPVAGQGFNLALRDVALLSELVVQAKLQGDDVGSSALLQTYAAQRTQDIQRVYRFTDTLVKTFSNAITPLAHLRSLGLLVVDMLPEMKHQFAKQSMGLNKNNVRQSKLLRGGRL